MLSENCLVWNVRGLNARARRNVVRELDEQENLSLLSLQETKLSDCTPQLLLEMCGPAFDFFHKPAINTSGGILVAWKTDTWSISNLLIHANSITVKVTIKK